MNKRERLQRPEADRTAPNRSWENAFRPGEKPIRKDTEQTTEASANLNGEDAPSSAGVARGVELGYKVISEQLAAGQRLGQQFMPGLIETWSSENLFNEQNIGQFLQIYGQFASMFMQAASGAAQTPNSGAAKDDEKTRKTRFSERDISSFDIEGAGPIAINLDLGLSNVAQTLKVHPLFALSAEYEPITEVSLELRNDATLRLRLRLPNAAVVGRFSGVVCDATTNETVGTLAIIKEA